MFIVRLVLVPDRRCRPRLSSEGRGWHRSVREWMDGSQQRRRWRSPDHWLLSLAPLLSCMIRQFWRSKPWLDSDNCVVSLAGEILRSPTIIVLHYIHITQKVDWEGLRSRSILFHTRYFNFYASVRWPNHQKRVMVGFSSPFSSPPRHVHLDFAREKSLFSETQCIVGLPLYATPCEMWV